MRETKGLVVCCLVVKQYFFNKCSKGLEVKVAPRQGPKGLKYDVEIVFSCDSKGGSTRKIRNNHVLHMLQGIEIG